MALGAVAGAVLAASGCAPQQPSPEPQLRVELVQLRGDVASGHLELRVVNESDAPVTVVRAAYASSRWSEAMVREDNPATIPPGLRRNLRVELPVPTCDGGPIEHLATLELADGSVLERVPSDPLGQVEALDDRVCDLRAFEEQVAALTWLEPVIPADGGGPAVLRLRVEPVGQGSSQGSGSVDAVDATVLLTPVDASGTRIEQLPIGLSIEPGDAPSVVEVPLEPGRCDLHAIAEDKQGTIFRVLVQQDGERVALQLVSPDAQRDALLDWVVARCQT